jgi:hypothetical protein
MAEMPDYLDFDVTIKGRFRVKLESADADPKALARSFEAKLDEGTFNEVIVDSVSKVSPV